MTLFAIARESVDRAVPTFNLRELEDDDYPIWRDHFVEAARKYEMRLRQVAAHVMQSPQDQLHRYVLRAYDIGLEWEAEGIAEEMIFGATFLVDQVAFLKDVGLFTAALRLGLTSQEVYVANLNRCARACEHAWLRQWDHDRFELELLRYGVSGIAKTSTVAAKGLAVVKRPRPVWKL